MSPAKLETQANTSDARPRWLWRMVGRLKIWLLTQPSESAIALTEILAAARLLHSCDWEHRADQGEEEHGKNPAKRYCKTCGREQWAFYHRFGNTRITWEDVPNGGSQPRRKPSTETTER